MDNHHTDAILDNFTSDREPKLYFNGHIARLKKFTGLPAIAETIAMGRTRTAARGGRKGKATVEETVGTKSVKTRSQVSHTSASAVPKTVDEEVQSKQPSLSERSDTPLLTVCHFTGSWFNKEEWNNMPRIEEATDLTEEAIAQWNQLRVMESIPLRDPSVLCLLGTQEIVLMERSIQLTAYDQLVLRCLKMYYSTLPNIGYSTRTFKLIHASTRMSLNQSTLTVDSLMYLACQEMDDRGLSPIIAKFGMLLFDETELTVPEIEDFITLGRLNQTVDKLIVTDADLFGLYNMIGHYAENGLECIDPVPVVISSNNVLEAYVNAVAKGSLTKEAIQPEFPPRDKDLPKAAYQEKRVAREEEPSAEKGEIPPAELKRKKENLKLLKPMYEKGSSRGGPSRRIEEADVQSGSEGSSESLEQLQTKHIGKKRKQLGGKKQEEAEETRLDLEAVIKSFNSAIANTSDKLDEIADSHKTMTHQLRKLADALTAFVSQGTGSGLQEKQSYNKALLKATGKMMKTEGEPSNVEDSDEESDLPPEIPDGKGKLNFAKVKKLCDKPENLRVDQKEEITDCLKKCLVQSGRGVMAEHLTKKIFDKPKELFRLLDLLSQ